MNSKELIWESKRVTGIIQQALLSCLKKHFGDGVTAGDATQHSADSAFPFQNFGLLRMNGQRKTGASVSASHSRTSQPSFKKW